MSIQLKSTAEIAKLREANLVVADVLDALEAGGQARASSTWDLNEIAVQRLKQLKAESAFLGYHGVPGGAVHLGQRGRRPRHPAQGRRPQGRRHLSASTSAPSRTAAAATPPGPSRSATVSPSRAGADATPPASRSSAAIAAVRARQPPGRHRLGRAVARRSATAIRWSGSSSATASAAPMHEDPQVPNYGDAGKGRRLSAGLVIAIEPMVNAGEPGSGGQRRRVDGCNQRW